MEITNVKVYDLEESIKASKYPMAINTQICSEEITNTVKSLGNSYIGSGHDNFLNGIRVAFDLTVSNKVWVELERYHFFDFVSSQSTMHKITKLDIKQQCNQYVWDSTIESLEKKVKEYNEREQYLKSNKNLSIDEKNICIKIQKELYLEILYNVPSGFELTARMTTNYRQLKTVFYQRKNHKLPEWREFCSWLENNLPYFKELCLMR